MPVKDTLIIVLMILLAGFSYWIGRWLTTMVF
jgi:predicted ABC-type exoprotein transport system permease subunit